MDRVIAIPPMDPISDISFPRTRWWIWDLVSKSPLHSLWDLQGVPVKIISRRVWRSLLEDDLVSRSAELGFYFIFAIFPCLFTLTSLLGVAAHSASRIYYSLLGYMAVVLPQAAVGPVLAAFNQITTTSSGGKLTFGLVASLWSASVGFSAIQTGMNTIYKVKETRSYLGARFSAIGVALLLSALITLILAALLGADYFSRVISVQIAPPGVAIFFNYVVKAFCWLFSIGLLSLIFSLIYYFAPNVEASRWHWLTPGSAVAVGAWLTVSLGFRLYVHVMGDYSSTYGSFGAVIILLTWFYLTGLVLLLGAEINSEIEAAVLEGQLKHEK